MVVPVKLTETTRNVLGTAACTFCAVLSFIGFWIIVLGIYVQTSINNKLILLESFNAGFLPNFLVSIGTLVMLFNGVCAKIALDGSYAETADKYKSAMIPCMALAGVVGILILSGSIACLTYGPSVEKALHNGIIDAMKRYRYSKPVKVAIDKMQMLTRCCGSRLFEDWFLLYWIELKYMNPKRNYLWGHKTSRVKILSVPFSCCNIHAKRPCINEEVYSVQRYRNYRKYKDLTLYRQGCTAKLVKEMENKILKPVGVFVHIVFYAQLVLIVLLRYIQTSVRHASLDGDPMGTGKGYLLPAVVTDKLFKKAIETKAKSDKKAEVGQETELEDTGIEMEDSLDPAEPSQDRGDGREEEGDTTEDMAGSKGGENSTKDKKQKDKHSRKKGKSKKKAKSKSKDKKGTKSKSKKNGKSGAKKKDSKKKGKKK